MAQMARRASGLWVPHGFDFWEHRNTKRTVTAANGRRGLVTVDDSGTAMQIECGEQLHAVVRPKPIKFRLSLPRRGA